MPGPVSPARMPAVRSSVVQAANEVRFTVPHASETGVGVPQGLKGLANRKPRSIGDNNNVINYLC